MATRQEKKQSTAANAKLWRFFAVATLIAGSCRKRIGEYGLQDCLNMTKTYKYMQGLSHFSDILLQRHGVDSHRKIK